MSVADWDFPDACPRHLVIVLSLLYIRMYLGFCGVLGLYFIKGDLGEVGESNIVKHCAPAIYGY